MSVQLIANNPNVPYINVANGTFYELHRGPLKKILGMTISANDLEASKEQAEACAKALELWTPPQGWFKTGKEISGLIMFMDFFRRCGGFTAV